MGVPCEVSSLRGLREVINLLLEEEKGGTDGPQLSFVHDKGELLMG